MPPSIFKIFSSKSPENSAATTGDRRLAGAHALYEGGQLEEAAAICRDMLDLDPIHFDSLALLCEITAKNGQSGLALEMYERLISLKPDSARAHYKRGNLLKDRGEFQDALASYDRAIALDPNHSYAYCNRGVVLERLERMKEACESYERAIEIDPTDALAHYNLGTLLRILKRSEDALASYDRAIALHPGYLECLCNRGILLTELKQWNSAMASFDQAIALKPDFAPAYFNRGNLFVELRRDDMAVADFDRAVTLDPNNADVFHSRAYTEIRMQRYEAAVESCDRALALKPDFSFLAGIRQYAKMHMCDWSNFDAEVERLTREIEQGRKISSPFAMLSLIDAPRLHREAAQIWTRDQFPVNHALPAIVSRSIGPKIRVGYFSSDFYDHVVGVVTALMFELHDRSKFEITAFSYGPDTRDPVRQRLEKAFDRFIDVGGKTDREVALLARDLSIDIAVDLSGHTQASNKRVFALRAAPLQVNYLGYPGTSGADYMDYLICDRIVVPASERDHYTEKIVCLPDSYLPYDSTRKISDVPFTREQLGLPATGFVFCCFNNTYKITPMAFDRMMRILGRTEGSVLWLSRNSPTAVANLRKEAAQRGIEPERLVFADRVASGPDHLARLRVADLFLDTLPYSAHATAMDALWSGLPVLTCRGRAFAGRVATSLLTTVDLPELIAATPEQFEDQAVELFTNRPLLAQVRAKLSRNRLATPLFDTPTFTRNLEKLFSHLHRRYHAGLPPEHLDAERACAKA